MICIDFSLLYGHLDAEKILPKLPEKDLMAEKHLEIAESFHQRFATNLFIIRALLWYGRPSHGLLKFCDTLETTPGQEHLGRKLLKGTLNPFHDICSYTPRCRLIHNPEEAMDTKFECLFIIVMVYPSHKGNSHSLTSVE